MKRKIEDLSRKLINLNSVNTSLSENIPYRDYTEEYLAFKKNIPTKIAHFVQLLLDTLFESSYE